MILLGALGGMASGGILGMFVGATLLALGYQIFMGWIATSPNWIRQFHKTKRLDRAILGQKLKAVSDVRTVRLAGEQSIQPEPAIALFS